MKAAVHYKYGSPEVLQIKDLPKPEFNDDEVLIKISASSVSMVDSIFRKGNHSFARMATGLTKPKKAVLGTEFSGIISGVGKNVSKFKVGDEVFGTNDSKYGTYAEYIVLSENEAFIAKPENLSLEESAGVPSGALTALPFLRDAGKIKKGDNVLIVGASGSVGSYAVQFAKFLGAQVTGVCSTSNVDMVKSLGADNVIDYKKEDFTHSNDKYDIILDSIGISSFNDCKNNLTENGIYLCPVISTKILFQMLLTSKSSGKKAVIIFTGLRKPNEKLKDLHLIKKLIEEGKIKPVIDKIYPLEEISQAHAYVDAGHKKGNVIIKI